MQPQHPRRPKSWGLERWCCIHAGAAASSHPSHPLSHSFRGIVLALQSLQKMTSEPASDPSLQCPTRHFLFQRFLLWLAPPLLFFLFLPFLLLPWNWWAAPGESCRLFSGLQDSSCSEQDQTRWCAWNLMQPQHPRRPKSWGLERWCCIHAGAAASSHPSHPLSHSFRGIVHQLTSLQEMRTSEPASHPSLQYPTRHFLFQMSFLLLLLL